MGNYACSHVNQNALLNVLFRFTVFSFLFIRPYNQETSNWQTWEKNNSICQTHDSAQSNTPHRKKTKKSKIDMNQLGLVIVIRRPNMVLAELVKIQPKWPRFAKALFRKCLTYRFSKTAVLMPNPKCVVGVHKRAIVKVSRNRHHRRLSLILMGMKVRL